MTVCDSLFIILVFINFHHQKVAIQKKFHNKCNQETKYQLEMNINHFLQLILVLNIMEFLY